MLLEFNPYVIAAECMALALLIVGIMYSLEPFLAKIPWIGGQLANAARSMGQAITHALGAALSGVTHAVGASLSWASQLIDHTYNQFRRHAVAILQTATIVGALVAAYHALKSLVNHVAGSAGAVIPRVKTLEKEWKGIEHRVKTLERELAHGIGHDLRVHIKALERWEKGAQAAITQTIPRAIAGVAGDVAGLKQFLGIRNGINYLDWVKAVGIAGLAALGLKGLACDNNPLKNQNCESAIWGDLSTLLGVIAAVLAVENFDALVHEMQQVEQGVISGMHDLFNLP